MGWGYSNIFEIKDRVGVDENVGLLSLRKPIKPVTLVYIPRVVHKNNRIQSSGVPLELILASDKQLIKGLIIE